MRKLKNLKVTSFVTSMKSQDA